VVAVGASAGWAHPGEAARPVFQTDDRWSRHASPHFDFYSRNSARESREVLDFLETLRALYVQSFAIRERAPQAVTVYYFAFREEFLRFVPKLSGVGAFYQRGPVRAVIVLARSERFAATRRMIAHEFVHHLVQSTQGDMPLWYHEGMAGLLSTLEVDATHVTLGLPGAFAAGLRERRLLPLEELFGVDHGSKRYAGKEGHEGQFHAQSWALLHYWYFGESGIPAAAVARFVRQVEAGGAARAGASLRAEFQRQFGMDYPEMEARLEKYLADGRYRFSRLPRAQLARAGPETSVQADRESMTLRLAELDLRLNLSAAAHAALAAAAARPAPEPEVLEALGMEAWMRRDLPRARAFWEQAVARGGRNPALRRELEAGPPTP